MNKNYPRDSRTRFSCSDYYLEGIKCSCEILLTHLVQQNLNLR